MGDVVKMRGTEQSFRRRCLWPICLATALILGACAKAPAGSEAASEAVTPTDPAATPTPSPQASGCAKNLSPIPVPSTVRIVISFCGDELILETASQYFGIGRMVNGNEIIIPQNVVQHGPNCDYMNVGQRPFCLQTN